MPATEQSCLIPQAKKAQHICLASIYSPSKMARVHFVQFQVNNLWVQVPLAHALGEGGHPILTLPKLA